ncbi:MAG: response regulator [Verrucomicrobiota bacterium]|jgi:DNA-binding response OmpR family regulator
MTALFLLFRGRWLFNQFLVLYSMRRKILVVEDDTDQLELIRVVLEKAGFAIGTAANGTDALVKTRSISPDLIILDLMLPGLNGFDICETLRKDPQTASLPIIMLTGLCSEFGRLAGLESGASEFLTKPFKTDELVSKVDKLLRAYGSSKAKARNKSKPELKGPCPSLAGQPG